MKKITVIGSGAWGTTMGILFSKKVEKIVLWCHEDIVRDSINNVRINEKYLPGVNIPNNIEPVSSLEKALESTELIVFAVPSAFAGVTLNKLVPFYKKGIPVMNITKGFEEEEEITISESIRKKLNLEYDEIAVLSGPNLAREVVAGQPSSTVIASFGIELTDRLISVLNSKTFRVYSSTDVRGVELGGALKNIYALGAGICDGLRFGANTKSAFLTRCMAEMIRIGNSLEAEYETFFGLSGMGDLLATSTSVYSRNRTVGEYIGQGMSLMDSQEQITGIAEGVTTVRIIMNIIKKHEIDCPIAEEIFAILFRDKDPGVSVSELMCRTPKKEFRF